MPDPSLPATRWTTGHALRATLFVVLASLTVGQPLVRQGLGIKTPKFVRTWQMFVGFGTDICDVRYYTIDPDGGRTRLDPIAALGFESRREAPKSVWRVGDDRGVARLGQRLCVELDGREDVRVEARCATRSGWKEVADGSQPLCATIPRSSRSAERRHSARRELAEEADEERRTDQPEADNEDGL